FYLISAYYPHPLHSFPTRTLFRSRVRSLLRQKAFTDELERAEAVLFALARSIEEKDPYTEGHCARLAEYSTRLGEYIGLSAPEIDRKSTRLNSSHGSISYAVFCLK